MRRLTCAILFTAIALTFAAEARGQDTPPNFQEHIQPIIDDYCIGCHRGSRARNGLKLGSMQEVLEGGSSGAAIVPGDAMASLLYQVIAHEREPFMPLDEEKIPAELIERVRAWIDGGAIETAGGQPLAKPKPAIDLAPIEAGAQVASVMPVDLRVEPFWWSEAPAAVIALATAPSAPLIAIGGHKQVCLYHGESFELLGLLDFPEGSIHCLRFSRQGTLLLAGGGRGAKTGRVVGWNVATGERVLEIGDEPDVVLSADISSDHTLLALGGPDGVVRVYTVQTGALLYEITQHTDWVTEVTFSPDGVLLASGDRAGGQFVWEAMTGREFHALAAHRGAVSALDWRRDSMVLLSAGADGVIQLSEMENGSQVRSWSSHGGVLDAAMHADGRIVSAGRDRLSRLWQATGQQVRQYEAMPDLASSIVMTHDGARLIVGDWRGNVTAFTADDGGRAGRLAPNPPTLMQRQVGEREAAIGPAQQRLIAAQQHAGEARQSLDQATATAEQALQQLAEAESVATGLAAQQQDAQAALDGERARAAPIETRLAEAQQSAADSLATQKERAEDAGRAKSELAVAIAEALAAEQALDAATDAQRPGAEERLHLARQLLEGATAVAQRASAQLAEVEVELERWTAQRDHWLATAGPLREAVAGAETALREVNATVDEHQAKLEQLRQASERATGAVTAADERLTQSQAVEDGAREELDAARASHAQAQRDWAVQREAILAARGRVPDPPSPEPG